MKFGSISNFILDLTSWILNFSFPRSALKHTPPPTDCVKSMNAEMAFNVIASPFFLRRRATEKACKLKWRKIEKQWNFTSRFNPLSLLLPHDSFTSSHRFISNPLCVRLNLNRNIKSSLNIRSTLTAVFPFFPSRSRDVIEFKRSGHST